MAGQSLSSPHLSACVLGSIFNAMHPTNQPQSRSRPSCSQTDGGDKSLLGGSAVHCTAPLFILARGRPRNSVGPTSASFLSFCEFRCALSLLLLLHEFFERQSRLRPRRTMSNLRHDVRDRSLINSRTQKRNAFIHYSRTDGRTRTARRPHYFSPAE